MKLKILAGAFAAMVLASGGSSANLLTNGDFEGAAPLGLDDFLISNRLGAWIGIGGGYTRSATGSGDFFAKHRTDGNGGDYRLVQFIDAGANGIIAGATIKLEFDYIYDFASSANATDPKNAYLVGFTSDRTYQMYVGTGPDGVNFDTNTQVVAPDVLLGTIPLSPTATWLRDQVISAPVGANFYAIGVVFQASCWGPPGGTTGVYCDYDRGFDNVSLEITQQAPGVPEPGTLALLGLGLAGLAAARRRKQ